MSLDVDTFVNGLPNMTPENEPTNESTTLVETTGEPPTSDSQLFASSTNNVLLDVKTTTSIYNRQRMSSDSTVAIAAAAALGAIACLSCFMTSALFVILIIQRRKRNNGKSYDYAWYCNNINHFKINIIIHNSCLCAKYAASFTDSGVPVAYSKPRKSKKTKPAALPCTMASNPIYEGQDPVYEVTPGEAVKALISPTSSTPTTPADITPRYFGMPPSLPPPRNASVTMLPKLETVDEIDAIKASIKDAKIPQSGDDYMIMNGAKPDGKTDLLPSNGHVHDTDKNNDEVSLNAT